MSSRVRWNVGAVAQVVHSLGTTHAAAASTALGSAVNLASTLFDTSDRYFAAVTVVSTSTGSSTRHYTFTVRGATASGGTYSSTNVGNTTALAIQPSSSPSTGAEAQSGLISFLPLSSAPFIKIGCVGAGAGTAQVAGFIVGVPASL